MGALVCVCVCLSLASPVAATINYFRGVNFNNLLFFENFLIIELKIFFLKFI